MYKVFKIYYNRLSLEVKEKSNFLLCACHRIKHIILLIYCCTTGRLSWNRNITPIKYLFHEYGCVVRINGPLVNDIVMIHR